MKNAISYHAPEVFAALARAGHVKEAGPLVEHIRDAPQRRTALERERWQRHQVFLLNPER